MRHPARFWVGAIGVLGLIDLWADRNGTDGDTFSECSRALFRTDTPAGKARFVAAWALLSACFVPHILKSAKNTLTS